MRKRLVHCVGVGGNDADNETNEQNMKKYYTVQQGSYGRMHDLCTFQGRNAKRDAARLAKRCGGRVKVEVSR